MTTGVSDANSASPDSIQVEPLPAVNAADLWQMPPLSIYTPDPDLRTISVEVLNVVGNSAAAIDPEKPSGKFVFYDTETLAIVHRAKSRSSGLVQTKVWEWCGKNGGKGEKEERKLAELSKRFNTGLVSA